MSDLSQLSDGELLAQIQAAQAASGAAAMSHTGTGGYDPQNSAWMQEYGPLAGMSLPEKVAAGAGRGMVHVGHSLGNALGVVSDEDMAEARRLDAPLMASGGGQVGNWLGEAALTAPLGMGAGAAAARMVPALSGPISQGVLQGATQGYATAEPGQRGANTLLGGAAGMALPASSAAAQKLIYGLKRTPSAQRLLDEGVDLTPGQMNPGGIMNQFEQASESLPLVKQWVHSLRESAEHQAQAAIIGKGAAPGAPPIEPSENIHDMLQQAYDSYAPLYDQAKGYPVSPNIMRTTGADIPLSTAFQAAAKAPGVPKSLQSSENDWLQDRLTQLPKSPDSADLLQLRSDIRQRGRLASLKTDTDSSHVANIAGRAEQRITDALNSQLPPEPLAALASADGNYGNYKIIENAVAASKDNLAGLTPQKLSQAVYNATPDAKYARGGGGPLRELARAGTDVFQNVSPPTGARIVTLGTGASALALHPYAAGPLGAAALGMVVTPTGRRIAQGATKPQQLAQGIANAGGKALPAPVKNAAAALARGLSTGAAIPYVPATALTAAGLVSPDLLRKEAN